MAFLSNLLGNIGNAFLGKAPLVQQPQQTVTTVYPQAMQAFFDNLPNNQSLMTKVNNSPHNQGYSIDEVKQKIAQGFNLGVPEIAQEQAKWGINIPKSDFQKDMANLGQFNFYPTQLNTGVATAPRQGGILNDFMAGARENYSQGFNSSNWGRNKSLATRIGEGIGTGLRWFDTPLGRGLAAMGLSALTGYGTPLEEFATATVGRQQNRTKNQLYRKQLAEQGIDTSDITGNIDEKTYQNLAMANYRNNLLTVKRDLATLGDNTKRAGYIMQALNNGTITPEEAKARIAEYGITINDFQKSNATRNADVNEQLAPYRAYQMQVAPQIAMGNLGVAQGNLALRQAMAPLETEYKLAQLEKLQNEGKQQDKATQKQYSENMSTIADINRGLELIKENPKAYTYFKGKVGADIANRIDPKGVKTRTQIDNITAVYRKWLTGAQMSDAERKAYERFLPAPSDNAQIVQAKLEGMRDSIQRKNNILMNSTGQIQQTNNNFKVDNSALQAEMRKRGLL